MRRLLLWTGIGWGASVAAVFCACDTAGSTCDDGGIALPVISLTVQSAAFVPATGSMTTTTTTGSANGSSPEGGAEDDAVVSTWSDGSITTSTTTTPPTALITLAVSAEFACSLHGSAHATITTSAGQFTNAVVSSSSSGAAVTGSGGTMTLTLTNVESFSNAQAADATLPPASSSNDGSISSGYESEDVVVAFATLELTEGQTTQVQVAVGDVSTCLAIEASLADADAPVGVGADAGITLSTTSCP